MRKEWKNREGVEKAKNSNASKHPRKGLFFPEVAAQQCAAAIVSVLGTSTDTEPCLEVTCWKSEPSTKYCDKQQLHLL